MHLSLYLLPLLVLVVVLQARDASSAPECEDGSPCADSSDNWEPALTHKYIMGGVLGLTDEERMSNNGFFDTDRHSEEERLMIREERFEDEWVPTSFSFPAMKEFRWRKERGFGEYYNPHLVYPRSDEWIDLMERRLIQLESNPAQHERWDGMISWASQAYLLNFTDVGYKKVKAPEHLQKKLREKLDAGLKNMRSETKVKLIGGEQANWVDIGSLSTEVMNELTPLHEAWAGVELDPVIAYGLRVYQEDNNLLMHVDKSADHIISSIFHVGHDDDSEPWPLVIEGFDGKTAEVTLEAGEMLFYESAKCLHGRPTKFKGEWYSSLFIHYRPKDWNVTPFDLRTSVPPSWMKQQWDEGSKEDVLRMVTTGFWEPECGGGWCALKGHLDGSLKKSDGFVLETGAETGVKREGKKSGRIEERTEEKIMGTLGARLGERKEVKEFLGMFGAGLGKLADSLGKLRAHTDTKTDESKEL